jgi:voltage-gated potassium channel
LSVKHSIYLTLEKEGYQNDWAKRINTFLVALIFANVIAVIMHSVKGIESEYREVFDSFEVFSVMVFGLEYLLRVWVCTENPKYQGGFLGRLSYMTSGSALIDFFAILPFFLAIFSDQITGAIAFMEEMNGNAHSFAEKDSHETYIATLRFITLLRYARLLRIFKLRRYSHAIDTLIYVIKDKKEELVIIFFTILLLLILSSSIMYLIENKQQPETFSSIPATMWWGIATLTTVGYGDMYPITPLGKFFGAIVAVLGIAMFAIPAGLISSGFTRMLQKQRKTQRMDDKKSKKARICPHCGKETDLIED